MAATENGTRISILIKEINSLINQDLRKEFSSLGLTIPQLALTGMLLKHGEMKISDLSRKLSLSNSTVSGIVDRLENQNIVSRIRYDKDRRAVYVNITEEYRNIHKSYHDRIMTYLDGILSKVDAKEINEILRGLELLKDILENKTVL